MVGKRVVVKAKKAKTVAKKPLNPYAKFVKKHFKEVFAETGSAQETMRALGKLWKRSK